MLQGLADFNPIANRHVVHKCAWGSVRACVTLDVLSPGAPWLAALRDAMAPNASPRAAACEGDICCL